MSSPGRLYRTAPRAHLCCAGMVRSGAGRADGASPRRRSIRASDYHPGCSLMIVQLHKNAATTPATRRALQAAPASVSTNSLAKKYGLNARTVDRWRGRTTVEDASHRPKQIIATLDPVHEEVVVEARRTLLLPLDDLLVVVRQFICPTM